MQNTLENQNQIIKTEVLAGCTTFVASVYIILTNAGISQDAAMMATIFTCALSTILMGVLSNTPFIVVPGMGINSLFTYTIVNSMGLSWQEALGAVFVSGIIFTIIASTNITFKINPKYFKTFYNSRSRILYIIYRTSKEWISSTK